MSAAVPGLKEQASHGTLVDHGLVAELVEDLGRAGFASLLDVFEADFLGRIAILRGCLASGDSTGLNRTLHAMTGSSISIGGTSLAALCRATMNRGAVSDAQIERVEAITAATLAVLGASCDRAGRLPG